MMSPDQKPQIPVSVDEASTAERVRIKEALFSAIAETPGYKATQLAEAAGVTDATLSFMKTQGRDVRIIVDPKNWTGT